MGRVIRHEVIALRCELRSCNARYALKPFSVFTETRIQRVQLAGAVQRGWVIVFTPQLRSYCPLHDAHALMCSCRTNPDRAHLCVRHDAEAASLLWGGIVGTVTNPASGAAAPIAPAVEDGAPAASQVRQNAA